MGGDPRPLFGVGAGFTLDEFALWIHLRDVYWAEEGPLVVRRGHRRGRAGGLIVVGGAPFICRARPRPPRSSRFLIAVRDRPAAGAARDPEGKLLLG